MTMGPIEVVSFTFMSVAPSVRRDALGFFDDDRNVGLAFRYRGALHRDLADLVDDVAALHDLAEHGVAGIAFARVVQHRVVAGIDEELRRGRVTHVGARHRDRVRVVGQAVGGFILDRRARGLLRVVLGEAAALDHEGVDDAMEYGAVVVAGVDVLHEVVGGDGRLLLVQLEDDRSHGGGELHLDGPGALHGGLAGAAGGGLGEGGGDGAREREQSEEHAGVLHLYVSGREDEGNQEVRTASWTMRHWPASRSQYWRFTVRVDRLFER